MPAGWSLWQSGNSFQVFADKKRNHLCDPWNTVDYQNAVCEAQKCLLTVVNWKQTDNKLIKYIFFKIDFGISVFFIYS